MNKQTMLCCMALAAFFAAMTVNSFADLPAGLIKNNLDGSQTLGGHVPTEVKNGKAVFKYHASQNIDARIILPLQNAPQLNSLINDLYSPQSPKYHQFITPVQFSQQFGPSSIDVQAIQEYLKSNGIAVTGPSASSNVLNVTGPSSAFEKAFGFHINNYQNSDGRMFFAPDADPVLPAPLAGKISAVGGLDNLARFRPHLHKVPKTDPQALSQAGTVSQSMTGTGPGGFLAPQDVKTAYNMNTIPSNGTGQTIALFELDGFLTSDVMAYDQQFGINFFNQGSLSTILLDGFNGIPCYDFYFCYEGAQEVTLDIDLLTAFAPYSSILVYEAPNTNEGWMDEWAQIAADNKAKTVSCSWGGPELNSPFISFENIIFAQMAAQGQAVFVASGDYGAYTSNNPPDDPAVEPYVTSVGISALSTNSDGTYNSETASLYGGGGISLYQSIPFYQVTAANGAVAAALVSKTMRNVPDVVLTADYSTAYAFYIQGDWDGYFGSSLATPIWAAFLSLVNQGLGSNGPIGFANTALYQIANTSSYASDFHDITTGNNGYFPAESGFDDATGLGSFNGLNLYNDLVQTGGSISAPPKPTGLKATAGTAQVSLSWNLSAGATSYNVKRATVSGGPYTVIGTTTNFNTFYFDNAVSQGNTYYYVVSAVNSHGQSANSSQVSATPVFQPPAAPSGLTATAGNAQVVLSWNVTPAAVSYNVKRATVSGGPYTTLTNVSSTGYVDASTGKGVTYYYVVSAVNAAGEGANSAETSAVPVWAPPGTFALSIYSSNGVVQLMWYPAAGAVSYDVGRSTVNGGPYTTIAASVKTINNSGNYDYFDSSVTNGTTYHYIVTAHNAAGKTVSQQQSATPIGPLGVPTGITISSSASQGITISLPIANGVQYYNVKRSTVNGGPYILISQQPPGAIFYDNNFFYSTNLQYGTTYYYVVTAVNTTGQAPTESPNSPQLSAKFLSPIPATPTGLKATAGNAQVALSWNAVSNTRHYSVFRSTTSGGPYSLANFLYQEAFARFTDTQNHSYPNPPVNGTKYYYVVAAVGEGGQSPYSAEVSATYQVTNPQAPVAGATVSATSGVMNVTLFTFDSYNSVDTGALMDDFNWNFGDGTSDDGFIAGDSHIYSKAGTYTPVLTVTDTKGLKSTYNLPVITISGGPTALGTVNPYSGSSGVTNFTFDGSASTDPVGTITSYAWQFGDGNTGSGKIVNHTFLDSGLFYARLTVTDNKGNQSVNIIGDVSVD